MSATRIVHTVASDNATISATTEALAASNMQSIARNAVWRSTNTSSTTIYGHWEGEDRTVGFLGLFLHRLHGASYTFTLYSDQSGTVVARDVTGGTTAIATQIAIGSHVWGGVDSTSKRNTDLRYYEQPTWKWFPMTVCKSFRLVLSGTPDLYSYYQIGRLVVGPYFELTRPPKHGMRLTWVDDSLHRRSLGGTNRRMAGSTFRRLEFDLHAITEAERPIWDDLRAANGTWADMVVSVYAGEGGRLERDYLINGCFASDDPLFMERKVITNKVAFDEN